MVRHPQPLLRTVHEPHHSQYIDPKTRRSPCRWSHTGRYDGQTQPERTYVRERGTCVVVVLYRPLARKLVVADSNVDAVYFMLSDRQSQWLAFRKNQETHKPEQNPGYLPRSAFRSASLRFITTTTTTTTTTTYGHRVRTELCPTGLVVFCSSASHSDLPLFVCNMITHRRWCFASCLATKTHHG